MKNYLMFALLLGAATTMAFGQVGVSDAAKISVACPDDECHVTQVFMGQGGFVGMAADGFDEVNFVVTCGSISASGKAMPNAAGVVSQLLSDDNGLSCHVEGGGSVEVHGVMDGAWYYITDEMNTAVANLLPKDAMDNDATPAANPGSADIKVMPGDTASYVKQLSTGRVGIVSHILPEPPPAPATLCGGGKAPQVAASCMLGDGGTMIGMRGLTQAGQTGGVIDDVGASIRRNTSATAGGDYTLTLSLWGNGSGHVSVASPAVPLLGHATAATNPSFDATWTVRLTNATPGTGQDLVDAGVGISGDVLTIQHADTTGETYCEQTSSTVAVLEITGTPGTNAVLPAPKEAKRTLEIGCPGSAANQGQELVPDNPFPTDK